MNAVYPGYYKNFKCIAEKCTHSCCIGWEIDIDDSSVEYYDSLEGKLADRLHSAISRDGQPHFILDENERCPFLNKDGLCDIILELGEDALCDICTNHPRFFNYFSDCVEIGVGLCCEAAADLILKSEDPFVLEGAPLTTDFYSEGELSVVSFREELFDIMRCRELPVFERHSRILEHTGAQMPQRSVSEWCDIYLSLEQLDPHWSVLIKELQEKSKITDVLYYAPELELAREQLTQYFLYRHLPFAVNDNIADIVRFAILSTNIVTSLSILDHDKAGFSEYARMYSAEIEYSEENTQKLYSAF